MTIRDIVLVTEKQNGKEKHNFMPEKDFLERYVYPVMDDIREAVDTVRWLRDTKQVREEWCELPGLSGQPVFARFCADREQMKEFLAGGFYDPKANALPGFEKGMKRCTELLASVGLKPDGREISIGNYHYEKLWREFTVGETIHNFNGSDYRILEKYSPEDLLLMDTESGNFVVGIGTAAYVRWVKGMEHSDYARQHGIEWDHGVYLGKMPSEINFRRLRAEYAVEKDWGSSQKLEERKRYDIEITETLQRTVGVEAENLSDAVDEVSGMYYGGKVVLGESDLTDVAFHIAADSRRRDRGKERENGR